MGRLMFASLSHTHYWYEVDMHVESTGGRMGVDEGNLQVMDVEIIVEKSPNTHLRYYVHPYK